MDRINKLSGILLICLFFNLQNILIGAADGDKMNNLNNNNNNTKLVSQRYSEPISDEFYYWSNTARSWYAANYYCQLNGWSLVSTTNDEEIIRLRGFLQYYGIENNNFWSSANRLVDKITWRWGIYGPYINETQLDYTESLSTTEPNNIGISGNEDCMEVTAKILNSNYLSCNAERKFACQKHSIK